MNLLWWSNQLARCSRSKFDLFSDRVINFFIDGIGMVQMMNRRTVWLSRKFRNPIQFSLTKLWLLHAYTHRHVSNCDAIYTAWQKRSLRFIDCIVNILDHWRITNDAGEPNKSNTLNKRCWIKIDNPLHPKINIYNGNQFIISSRTQYINSIERENDSEIKNMKKK